MDSKLGGRRKRKKGLVGGVLSFGASDEASLKGCERAHTIFILREHELWGFPSGVIGERGTLQVNRLSPGSSPWPRKGGLRKWSPRSVYKKSVREGGSSDAPSQKGSSAPSPPTIPYMNWSNGGREDVPCHQ